VSRPGRPVVRLVSATALGGVAVGTPVTLTLPDGSRSALAVRTTSTSARAGAASASSGAPAGTLVVLAPAAGGWTVLTAT